MRIKHVIGVAALGAIALAACGGGSYSSAAAKHPSAERLANTSSANAVQSHSTALGQVLASSSGRTLYALTKDTKTNSTCIGGCAQAWPPWASTPPGRPPRPRPHCSAPSPPTGPASSWPASGRSTRSR